MSAETETNPSAFQVVIWNLLQAGFTPPAEGFIDSFKQELGASEDDLEWLAWLGEQPEWRKYSDAGADSVATTRRVLHALGLSGHSEQATPRLRQLLQVYTYLEVTAARTADRMHVRELRREARNAPRRRKPKKH